MEIIPKIDGFSAALLLVAGFGFIIFVHELGHFLVAKWVGIRVTQFAIGFGHSLLTYRKGIGFRVGTTEPEYHKRIKDHLDKKRVDALNYGPPDKAVTAKQEFDAGEELGLGETEYRLNYLPLGGYVKMVGQEDLDPTAVSDDPRAYNNKPVWARMCVVSAGVIMNAGFAVIFFIAAFLMGVEFPPAEVGDVRYDFPAAMTPADNDPKAIGLKSGDRIVQINGKAPSDFTDLRLASALSGPDEKVQLTVERPSDDGKTFTRLDFSIKPMREPESKMLSLGIEAPASLQVNGVPLPQGAELEKRGMTKDISVVAVDGQPIEQYWQLRRATQRAGLENRAVTVTLADKEKKDRVELSLTPKTGLTVGRDAQGKADPKYRNLLGLVPPGFISMVSPKKPADGKLMEGDVVTAINGVKWPTEFEIPDIIHNSPDDIEITVLRGTATITTMIHPNRGWHGFSEARIGIGVAPATNTTLIAGVLKDSPFASLKLSAQARIVSINDKAVTDYTAIRHALESSGGVAKIAYTLAPDPKKIWEETIQITPQQIEEIKALTWNLDETAPVLQSKRVIQKASGPLAAAEIGFRKTHLFMMQTYVTMLRLFQGTVPASEMRGPVGILEAGTTVTKNGLPYLLFFLGLISINLTVINFMPMPIVDGGLFVLLIIEKLRGKPVPMQLANALNYAGVAMILSIFLFVTYHDISRLVTG